MRPGEVRMYVCGITVYDYCHVGHARMMVAFDMVRRWLLASGYRVTYVRNITDIDDKIIRRAQENGEPIEALTARFIRAMDEDFAALGVEKPDHEPRATAYVEEMKDIIRRLQDRNLAYQAASGDVNYAVRRFTGYGKLSGKSLDELRAGERVDVDTSKHDPLDFVLWKRSKPDEPKWASPWGDGRPGWHIECSAMSGKLLGEHFDIHGGGEDLQFPHHENEIAQSEGARRRQVRQLLDAQRVRARRRAEDVEVARQFLHRARGAEEIRCGGGALLHPARALPQPAQLFGCASGRREGRAHPALYGTAGFLRARCGRLERAACQTLPAAMDDDFGTPEAVAVLFELANRINAGDKALAAQLRGLGGVLGLLQREPMRFLQVRPAGVSEEWIRGKIAEREAARRGKDYAAADRIRQELSDKGIALEDKGGKTVWRRL